VVEPVRGADVGGVGSAGGEHLLVVGVDGGPGALEALGCLGELVGRVLIGVAAGGDREVPHPLLAEGAIAVHVASRDAAAPDDRQPHLLRHARGSFAVLRWLRAPSARR